MVAKTKTEKNKIAKISDEFFAFLQQGGFTPVSPQPKVPSEELELFGEISNVHSRTFEVQGKMYRALVFKYVKPPHEDVRVGDCAMHIKALQQGAKGGILKKLLGGGSGEIKIVLAPEEVDKIIDDNLTVTNTEALKGMFEFLITKLF